MLTQHRPSPGGDAPLSQEDASAESLHPEALWRLFDGLPSAAGLLLAVSGGPDSTALMHLAAGWARSIGRSQLYVACVDHGLRPESRAEANAVVAAAQALGLPAERLDWTGDKPVRGIAERARYARYRLLAEHARRLGASHLLTGHTLDDQAETVMMRLARGSGLAGAGAMRRTRDLAGIALVRPLLGLRKDDLVHLCRVQEWPFVEDPGNRNPASARVRWRRLAPVLAAEGLTAERLGRFAERAARADEALRHIAHAALGAATVSSAGQAPRLRFDLLASHPDEIQLRAIGEAVSDTGAGDLLRLERLETLLDALRVAFANRRPLRRTLGGCVVALGLDGILSVTPEPRRMRGMNSAEPATSPAKAGPPPFTLTGRSLGKGTPASYIPACDTTARCADAVETHCAYPGDGQVVLLSAGRQ